MANTKALTLRLHVGEKKIAVARRRPCPSAHRDIGITGPRPCPSGTIKQPMASAELTCADPQVSDKCSVNGLG